MTTNITSLCNLDMRTRGITRFLLWLCVAAILYPLFPADAAGAERPVKKFELVTNRRNIPIDEGVVFEAFTFNGKLPGPLLIVDEGDQVEISVHNEDTITHGLSIHAANTQTSQHVGLLEAGQTKKLVFNADTPGVYMYHCAPGGHGIMTHTMGGMFGMVVVEPKTNPYRMEKELGRAPDLRLYVIQHEVYANGRDFFDGKALYVMFNGYNFRYVNEPIAVRPGDYLRIYYLNVGPNLTATFHVVGGIWNYLYYNGNPSNLMAGTQSAISGPTDSWVVEWQVPAEGPFTFLTHALGTQAIKGAIGILSSKKEATRSADVSSEGHPVAAEAEHKNHKRWVSPFGIGSGDLDVPHRFQPGERPIIRIVGNSFYPKIAEVRVGTTVTWVNEDVFDFLDGERTGQHDVITIQGPGDFKSPALKHADQFKFKFTLHGEYDYICNIHPYMKGRIKVIH